VFCPKCRAEYIEGVKICDDCGIALIDILPEENQRNENEYQKLAGVFTTNNSIEANFIKSLLESNGIICFIDNEHLVSINILMSQAVQIKVLVPLLNETKAKEIIAQYYFDLRNSPR
jgi:hypothetical protein